jgi:CheY-like chemotaxis protein
MHQVLLVVPDKDFCCLLSAAISRAGYGTTTAGTIDEATTALAGFDRVDHLVVEAFLPDGSGLALAEEARRKGKLVHVLRKRRGRIVVYDSEGTLFIGDRSSVATFLVEALLRARKTPPVIVAMPVKHPPRRTARRQRP